MKKRTLLAVLITTSLMSGVIAAQDYQNQGNQVYKKTDKNGVVTYTDVQLQGSSEIFVDTGKPVVTETSSEQAAVAASLTVDEARCDRAKKNRDILLDPAVQPAQSAVINGVTKSVALSADDRARQMALAEGEIDLYCQSGE